MKMLAIRICVGQRPLHSAKLLVMIAISRSRGLSMMRVATTPAALQPKPIDHGQRLLAVRAGLLERHCPG